MQTGTDQAMTEAKVKDTAIPTTTGSNPTPPLELAYNGVDRNAWLFGFNPQQELWNGRLAMIGIMAYFIWDFKGYSILRDVLHFIR
jgi:Chlorophyll A-B binding protein